MIFHINKRKRRSERRFRMKNDDYRARIASTGGFFAASKTGKKVATKLNTMLIPRMINMLSGPKSKRGIPTRERIISLLRIVQTINVVMVDRTKQIPAMIPLSE